MNAAPEQIAPLQPDAILLKRYLAESLGAPLESLGFPAVLIDLETPDQLFNDITTIGQLQGNETRAEEVIEFYDGKLDYIATGLQGLEDERKPRVLLIDYSAGGEGIAFDIPSASYLQTIQTEIAGGDAIWKETAEGGGWTTVNFEQIAAWDADKIFVTAFKSDAGAVVDELKADPSWRALRAVQNGEIYGFPSDLNGWDSPNPRWILGTLWLAEKIHPDRFTDLDIEEEIYGFYNAMFGMDQSAVDESMMPELKGSIP
ncbi:MAG: ABC transporter substrate-binding protein [Anaerolineae bacterium]|nr:ABC transporter substrate-binding protein [Anaerolineae bacterium]